MERDIQADRQRHTDRQTDIETQTERDMQADRHTYIETRQRDIQTDRPKHEPQRWSFLVSSVGIERLVEKNNLVPMP
jgi:hypothetical protein